MDLPVLRHLPKQTSNRFPNRKPATPSRGLMRITKNIEKNHTKKRFYILLTCSNLCIQTIKDVKELKAALKHLMDNDIRTKGKFLQINAPQLMIEQEC